MNVEKVKMLWIGAVIIAAAHCLANTASAAPVAMVTDIQGKGLIVSQSEMGISPCFLNWPSATRSS
jgi:hypothetical protein